MTDLSRDARSGETVAELPVSTAEEVAAAVDRAALVASDVAATSPEERRQWLNAVADALDAAVHDTDLVEVADAETGLGLPRLSGELGRCAAQLRFYGSVAADGGYLQATIDHATDTAPDLRRARMPRGPVAVLGASNFPFAFGTLGHDTGSGLAAGCPVVAKVHPAHPRTGRMLAEIATRALADAGAPAGAFAAVSGFAAGEILVNHADITALAFTGSQAGGLALWRQAQGRDQVIPVYAEMGTINPAVMTQAGISRATEIATGFVDSFTLGLGQFCTKPGLLLVPAGHDLPGRVAQAVVAADPSGWLLTEGIATAYAAGVHELVAAGATPLASAAGPDAGWSAGAQLLQVSAAALVPGSRLVEECFGPVALVAEYADPAELAAVIGRLQGALAGAVHTGGDDDPQTAELVTLLAAKVGRVMVDQWPTGVATTWAQHHGGPWPATTDPAATSVGAAALDRFTRPVAWQAVPDGALPSALQEVNPWRLPRRVDGRQQHPDPEEAR